MCFYVYVAILQMLSLLSPLTPNLVGRGGGTEPKMAAVIGGAFLANDSGDNVSLHCWLRWVRWKKQSAEKFTPTTMVPGSIVAGATNHWLMT